MFGHPNNRERIWRVLWDDKLRTWSLKYTLQELADILLLPSTVPLKLDYRVYLTAASTENMNVHEEELTRLLDTKTHRELSLLRSQAVHLERFRTNMTMKKVYDLSANCQKRRRCETMDNMLPCLTTSSQFWQLGHCTMLFRLQIKAIACLN